MRWTASRVAAMVFVLATGGFLTYAWTARAQLGGAGAAPAGAAEPPRALLQVDPPAGKEAPDALWQRTINTHTAMLREPHLLRTVAASEEVHKTGWYAQFKGADADAKATAALTKVLIVRPVQETALIEVRTSVEPAADAAVIANAICDQYVRRQLDQEQGRVGQEVNLLSKQANSAMLELNEDVIKQEHQKRLELGTEGIATAGKAGGDPAFNVLALELQEVVRARVAAEKDRDTAKRAVNGAGAQGGAAPKAALQEAEERVGELAQRQAQLQSALGKVNQALYELRLLDDRTTELRRANDTIAERIVELRQTGPGKSHTHVHIAAYATAP